MLLNLLLLPSVAVAQELMRFGCSQLTVDRLDPVVQPGQLPSTHMHQIIGGNSFNASMTPLAHDPPTLSTCTSCTYSEDFSNYWTASVYFKAKNGTFKRVPQVNNLGIGTKQGMTIYYIRGYQASARVTAFPPVCIPSLRRKMSPNDAHRVSVCLSVTHPTVSPQRYPRVYASDANQTVSHFPSVFPRKSNNHSQWIKTHSAVLHAPAPMSQLSQKQHATAAGV
jgi:hypothetical protein